MQLYRKYDWPALFLAFEQSGSRKLISFLSIV
jgi:hypothetical protein